MTELLSVEHRHVDLAVEIAAGFAKISHQWLAVPKASHWLSKRLAKFEQSLPPTQGVVEAGWQPIETAPKDCGILGYWMLDEKRGHIDRIWWDAEFEQTDWDDEQDEPTYRGAWTAGRVASWGGEEYAEEHPTHWRPLPAPPLASIGEEVA